MTLAIDRGINFMDNSWDYHNGRSERWMGQALKGGYFDITTGDLLEPPGFDSLDRYPVRIEDNRVIVTLPESASGHRIPEMVAYAPEIDRIVTNVDVKTKTIAFENGEF